MSISLDAFIDDAVRQRILAKLDAVERDENVRILLAIESGSRAWGFPSRDSDYDVRFVYLRPIERYLTLKPGRDVIELPVDSVLDVGGWDLRKALGLVVTSNAALLEWFNSPISYRDGGFEAERLRELARGTADLTALSAHYFHSAKRTFAEISASDNAVRLKVYCYAVRAVLALLWLRWREEAPPMNLQSLLAGLGFSAPLRSAIAALIVQKAGATEKDTVPRNAVLDELIIKALDKATRPFSSHDRADVQAKADALFASIVLDSLSMRAVWAAGGAPEALPGQREQHRQIATPR